MTSSSGVVGRQALLLEVGGDICLKEDPQAIRKLPGSPIGIELVPVRVKISRHDDGKYNWVKSFWLKVIIRAMFDYALWKESKEIGHRRCAEEARKWLFETSKLNNNLVSVCSLLDVSMSAVRSVAAQLTPEQVKRMEHIEHSKILLGRLLDGEAE